MKIESEIDYENAVARLEEMENAKYGGYAQNIIKLLDEMRSYSAKRNHPDPIDRFISETLDDN